MKIQEWIDLHKNASLVYCILDMRNLNALTHEEVILLHDFLWNKQKVIARQFDITIAMDK